ncbi:MAG: hypothetical protein M1838_001410 [Thelocarpon superellum]|nr:MAG: hypothetical protein M1838_001410 [Thelocarpon superellum]
MMKPSRVAGRMDNSNLTPIKIRGKRRQVGKDQLPKKKTPSAPASRRLSPLNGSREHQRKRPPARLPRTKLLSPLERLPTELLQRIFLLSMNLELPFVSRHVNRDLSSTYVFLNCALHAFQPALIGGAPDAALQSAVLSRKWMTQQLWRELRPQLEHSKGEKYRFASDAQIPTKILQGPSISPRDADARASFLADLVAHGAQVDWMGTTAGEVATAGLYDAIQQGHVEYVGLLVGDGVNVPVTVDVVRWAVMHVDFSRGVVQSLIAAALSNLRPDKCADILEDPVLREWATQQRDAGNPDGQWYLQALT